ncbi:1-aminocyclopropane-1-carboxylate deaminase [Capnocytophaga cynodegmi]|uniref:1-aminocyclopropane-1-carboxylate deaminase/D-cysteine desulfhydrase n=1 Tax=Capnocytophaga cynodegmi TaxID=28189 RepID=UPI001AD5ACD9|nr:pyridoxal-phosphate dependent enzyme [Capnocytophaga cynodegmi]GIM53204.1 1-aminocyclopropane-1-carboxylate deaminase [Capnocytophaga cynodegmi]
MEPLKFNNLHIENQLVNIPLPNGISLHIKREDKNHHFVSGNKLRKLKYNILQAQKEGKTQLLTFGGAYSNHIAATAAAGQLMGLKTIGFIRGEELRSKIDENPTLSFAQKCGMDFQFISRENYRLKHTDEFLHQLEKHYGSDTYIVPEGGTNEFAVKGCEEILTEQDSKFDVICSAVGTGGTISGLINSSFAHQIVLGFPALKGEFLSDVIKQYTSKTNWQLIHDYNFGGYAKVSDGLISFLNNFNKKTGILLDPIYTGKMIFAIFALSNKNFFKPNTKILAIHTGGLQGIQGINQKRAKKHQETLNYD